jgi:hypothetical protein
MAKQSRKLATAVVARVERQILVIRGYNVMLDSDLAAAYGVNVKQLNQAVKRNHSRFPADFMFRLNAKELAGLRSKSATSARLHGGRRYSPYAFTEHGAVMLASVLNSSVAIQASIAVVRAFVRLRELVSSNEAFRRKLDEIERKLSDHDEKIAIAFDAIRQLMDEPESDVPARPPIGYESESKRQARAAKRGPLSKSARGSK